MKEVSFQEKYISPYWDQIIIGILFLFFVSSVFQLVFNININFWLFILVGVASIYGFFKKELPHSYVIVCVIFGLFLLFGCVNGFLSGIPLYNIFSQAIYYLKPFVFFFFAYYFVKPHHFKQLLLLILIEMLLSLPFYLFAAKEFIDFSRVRLRNLGFFVSDSDYFSATLVNGKIIPRNPTFLFSYLDGAYVLYFLSAFYIVTLKSIKEILKRWPFILVSCVLFATTFSRSALIALPLTILAWLFLTLKSKRLKLIIIGVFLFTLAILGLLFAPQITYLLFSQESAIIHWANIGDALTHIQKYPWGSGLGTSGWQGLATSPMYLYAEGSIFTSVIELGIPFLVWYGLLGWITWKKSPRLLFPILLGYFLIAFVLPIGFSTQFNLLFFTALGIVFKRVEENQKYDAYSLFP